METLTNPEKKWFVFQQEETQGPYTSSELKTHLNAGSVNPNDLVWHSGMEEWLPASEAEITPRSSANKAGKNYQPVQAADYYFGARGLPWEDTAPASPLKRVRKNQLKTALKHARKVAAALMVTASIAGTIKLYRSGWLAEKSALLAVAMAGSRGLAQEEARELRGVLTAPLKTFGPEVSIALSLSDLARPNLYLGTNLPAGSKFDIIVEADSNTIIGTAPAAIRQTVSAANFLAEVRLQTLGELPKGEYRVLVADSSDQPFDTAAQLIGMPPIKAPIVPLGVSARILSQKRYFLGGTRDVAYEADLRAYHSKLRIKSDGELLELKQVIATLENQLNDTETQYREIIGLKASPKGGAAVAVDKWKEFDMSWNLLQKQLGETLEANTDKGDRFHRSMYEVARLSMDLIAQAHGKQAQQVTSELAEGSDSAEIQLTDQLSLARSSILSLKSKVALVEKLPPLDSGMPQTVPR